MNNELKEKDRFNIALSDIWLLLKKNKYKILSSALFMALIGAFFSLIKPIEYNVEATYREKTTQPTTFNPSLISMITANFSGGSEENEAISTLKSRKLLTPVIKKLNLQATIEPANQKETYVQRILNNAKVEYAHASNSLFPSLSDKTCPLKISSIDYQEEIPTFLTVSFLADGQNYQLLDQYNKKIGQGSLDEKFANEKFSFVLTCDENSKKGNYSLALWPMHLKAAQIAKKLSIGVEKGDKNFLKISYDHPDRQEAKTLVNQLIDSYLEHLKTTQDNRAKIQIDYLTDRQNQSEAHLTNLMKKHANALSEDVSKTGFADSQKEMEFLALSQHEFKQRLITNELEIKRLQNVQSGKCVFYDQLNHKSGDHSIINGVLQEIRNLKQERDALEIALKKSVFLNNLNLLESFIKHQQELETIQTDLIHVNQMISAISQNKPLDTNSDFFNDKRFVIKTWYEKIQQPEQKKQFLGYLDNLQRLLNVNKKIIEERMIHQQNPSSEYEGMSLKAAESLYVDYTVKVNEFEAKQRESLFLIAQLQNPDFEISSLSTALNDAVSHKMIEKTSELLLNLKDFNNRSDKELQQLQEELLLQKGFLLLHVEQINELNKLYRQLFQEKIYSLQNIKLELIHQEISVLEKNLYDYIDTRMENLRQEKAIIEEHMHELHQEMALLPDRWTTEKLIEQNFQTNKLIVQEVAKLVETKNIAHKLELIQSTPIDLAIAPLHPKKPGILLYSVVGAILGMLLSSGVIMTRALSNGILASSENLKLNNQFVVGPLRKDQKFHASNLEMIRRLQNYFHSNRLALITSDGLDYSDDYAKLLKKQGLKVLLIDLNENQLASQKGLVDFLEHKTTTPSIIAKEDYDLLLVSKTTPYLAELLNSKTCMDLLEKLNKEYDIVLASSTSSTCSNLAHTLINLFNEAALSINHETLDQLSPYFELGEQGKKIAFVMTDERHG